MGNSWSRKRLGEVLTLQRGFDLPRSKREPGPYPVIASTGQVGTHMEAMVKGAGVVIGRSGSLGGGQYIRHDFWPLNTTLWVKDFKGNNPRFCYYLLRSLDFQRFNVGSGVPTLNRNHIHPMPVAVPNDLTEQRAIAHILGTLDDKIELNRQMNETLDGIARAIFRSWFVDFDPARAKAEGRPTELPEEIDAVFPDSFEDSELGEIPQGWRVVPLSEVCARITDGAHKSPKSVDVGYAMASVKDMHHWGLNLSSCRQIAEEDYNELVRNDCKPRSGDVLVAKDGSYLKHIFVVKKDLELVILSSIAILRPNNQIDSHLLAFTLRSDTTLARMERYVSGAVLQRIVLKDFRQFPILVPPREIQQVWSTLVSPIVQQCWRNLDESDTLASLRDTLLPKLISGELRIPNVTRVMGRQV